jgi:hypothetical protein
MSDPTVAAIEADRREAAGRIRRYAKEYYDPGQREGFEVAAKIAEGWLRRPLYAYDSEGRLVGVLDDAPTHPHPSAPGGAP